MNSNQVENNIEEEMKALLYHFWITKEENQELYYQIKYNQNHIKDFIAKNLGSNFIIHDRFIKLEKVPTILKTGSKIGEFTSILEYVMLMILLMFLEDKTRGDKFILSDLIDYVKNTAITLQLDHVPDWNNAQDRRRLLNVIHFLVDLCVIKVKEEEKTSFADNQNAEALYEATGLSNYVMRIFDSDINHLTKPEEFVRSEFVSQDEEKGDIRRYRVFRNILYTPVVFSKDILSNDLDYIKKNRLYIRNEIDRKLNMDVEITHNMALLLEQVSSNEKDNFPNTKKLTDVVLMVNAKILEDIQEEKLVLDSFETITVNESYLEGVIKTVRKEKEPYIGKTFSNLTEDKFYRDILEYMEKYHLVEKKEDTITIYPVVSRLIGKTCEVEKDVEENAVERISLFGGNDEL